MARRLLKIGYLCSLIILFNVRSKIKIKFENIVTKVIANEGSAFFYNPPYYNGCNSYLFVNPSKIIVCNSADDYNCILEEADYYRSNGLIGYALISYEAGYILHNKIENLIPKYNNFPFFQFYFYDKKEVLELNKNDIDFSSIHHRMMSSYYSINNFRLNISAEEYTSNINKIHRYIEEGDTYQVNYTVKGYFDLIGDPSDLFMNLVFNQSAEYSALINNGNNLILSISPELFFKKENNLISVKPMKGTIARGFNTESDQKNIVCLKESVKDKAENVMIVDLLRNDLGRISRFGSVEVNSLFAIEKYETVFQMISEIISNLKISKLSEILKNIFPCGSITGAPKIRTMEIISELEKAPRNLYTGSIGLMLHNKDIFNVAIRTIVLDRVNNKGEIGIGSGIVWDSNPEDEFHETLLKSEFLTKPALYFELFETILFENKNYFLLDYHLERMKRSAEHFLFVFEEQKILNVLNELAKNFYPGKKYKVKINLNKWGNVNIQSTEFNYMNIPVKVLVSSKKINSNSKFQYFKTTNRSVYDLELEESSAMGYFDVIYRNEKGRIAEGSITNIFIRRGDSWLTPPESTGILNGCYRKLFLSKNKCEEIDLTLDQLIEADEVKLVNSIRKEIKVKEIWMNNEKIKSFESNIS